MGDAAFLSLNAVSGGLSAGLLQRLRGGSFTDGFTRGALGGSAHYAGMRLGSQRFEGAGLLGRQISATGISAVRNASEGRGLAERLFFPVGPLNVYVDRAGAPALRVKVNLFSLTTVVSAAMRPELRWDLGDTFSAGAPVFHSPGRGLISDGREVSGYVRNGTIVLSNLDSPPAFRSRVFAHERVHIAQNDWLFHVWSDPAEEWALSRLPGGATLYRYLDIDVIARHARWTFYRVLDIDHRDRLHEIEAYFLEGR